MRTKEELGRIIADCSREYHNLPKRNPDDYDYIEVWNAAVDLHNKMKKASNELSKVRSIDNFLSESEKDLISSFIDESIRRFKTTNHRTKTIPPRLDAEILSKLHIKKFNEWKNAVARSLNPNTGGFPIPTDGSCPIEVFLDSLKNVIDQNEEPYDYEDMLQVFEEQLTICGFSCPCPAGIV